MSLEAYRATLKDFREKMNKLVKMCESTDLKLTEANDVLYDGLINILDIKYFNAEIQKEIEGNKESITREKEKVEEGNLYYQNFLYQKEHIVSQINSCKNFPTPDMDIIKLPDEKEVKRFFSYSDDTVITKTDYLNYELETRKQLHEKVKELDKEKDESLINYKDTESFFQELPRYLNSLETSTLKAQKYLNVKITESKQLLNLSAKLPPPLYVLYNSLKCANNIDLNYDIQILGDESKVDDFYNNYKIDNVDFNQETETINEAKEEGEHSDHEETSNIEGKAVRKRTKKIDKASLNKITKFPLHVQLNISSNNLGKNLDTIPIQINLFYIPVFNVVTVEAVHSKGLYNTSNILSHIFTKLINFKPNENLRIEQAISNF
jgi:hypothetical protein